MQQQRLSTTTDAVLRTKRKEKLVPVTDSWTHRSYLSFRNSVHDSDLGTRRSLRHKGQISLFQEVSVYPLCFDSTGCQSVPPPTPSPGSIWGNWHEEASPFTPPSLLFSGNWIMSVNAFYTVISDWFILRMWQHAQSAETFISVYLFSLFLTLVSRLEQSLSENYGYFILRINSLAGIMSI